MSPVVPNFYKVLLLSVPPVSRKFKLKLPLSISITLRTKKAYIMSQNQCPSCFSDKHIFKGKYPLDYRLVITRAIYCCLNQGIAIETLKKQLNDAMIFVLMINSSNAHKLDFIYFPHFIELCIFHHNGDQGVLLIDRSKGCFPLVAYPNSESEGNKGDRVKALHNVFSDIYLCIDKIKELYKPDFEINWNETKKTLISTVYNYQKDEIPF